jgi:hypothetical protein
MRPVSDICNLLHSTFVPRGGIFPRPETHLTSLGACGEAEARLTWLSARCLSSCLFSAKFLSNKSAAGGSPAPSENSCVVSTLSKMMGCVGGKSVMGNGRVLSAGNSGSSAGGRVWIRVFGAAFVLLVAGSVLLGMGAQRNPQKSLAQASASSIPAAFGSVSSGSSSFVSSSSKSKPNAQALLSQLPMIFEPNQGQADSTVKFLAHGAGYSLFFDSTGAMLAMQTAHPASSEGGPGRSVESLRMTLAGVNVGEVITAGEPLPGKSNYFIGNDPQKWRTGIPQFAGVRYANVYPGIDLVFYGNQGRLEYDFKVAPGADPSQAELQFDGASKIKLSGGDLILAGNDNNVRLQAPRVYQRIGDREQPVEGHFVLRASNRVGFEIGAYDRSRELVIDPILVYSTYFGGSGSETYPSIAVNGDGNIYLAGSTTSPNLMPATPPVTPYQSTLKGTQNIFILDLNPSTGILYLTYLGGSGTDTNVGLAVDAGGNAYVAGTTTSTDFPTVGGYLSAPEAGSTGTSHVFVSKLSGLDSLATPPTLAYSTYLSGNGTDVASGMTIDSNADVFVTGTTTSTDKGSPNDVFPASYIPAPYQLTPVSGSTIQFFVTKVNTASISTLSVPYSTYFGGGSPSNAIAQGGGIAVDTAGNIYFSGTTNFFNSQETLSGGNSGDFPILNAYQPCLDSPPPTEQLPPVTCAAPTTTPYPTDAFVAKLNPAAAQTGSSQLIFSTYFGGSGEETGPAITIDTGAANIYLTGSTNSASGTSPGEIVLPISVAPFQMCLDTPVNPTPPATCTVAGGVGVPTDAYVARLNNITGATGSSTVVGLEYFSYLGGTGNDSGLAIAVDPAQGALITGATSSTDFPVSTAIGPIQSHLACAAAGCSNAYFAHIFTSTQSGQNTIGSYVTYFGGNGTDRGTSITIDPSLNTYFAGDTTSTNLETENPVQPTLNGPQNAFAVKLRTESNLCILNCPAPVVSPPGGVVGAGTAVTVTFTVTNQGPDLATDITVTGQLFFTSAGDSSATFTSATAGSGTCSTPNSGIVSCVIPTLQSGSLATVVMVVTPNGIGTGSVQATVGNNNDTNTQNTASASFTATTFSASVAPASATVIAGGTAFYTVNVNASPGFGSNVSLTCSSLPVGATCGFNPSTLSFNGSNNQSSALSVTTTARPPTTITSRKWHGPIYALWLMAPGMALLGLGGSKRRRNRLLAFLALSILFALVVLQPACSHQKEQPVVSGTPAGTYPLTVTATSGSNSVPIGFTLTVQ